MIDAHALAAAQAAHDADLGQVLGFVILAACALLATWHNARLPRSDRWW